MAKMNKAKRAKLLKEATIENISYTDSHFHTLEIIKKGINASSLLSQMQTNNYIGLDIGTKAEDFKERYKLIKNYPNIYLSSGVGPWATKSEEEHDKIIEVLEANIKKYPVKAIGETGIDNYWDYGTKQLQEDLFLKQINLANKHNLPIIIHNREADEQIINIIKNNSFSQSGIIHCFSSNIEFAKIALDKGFYISFAANITYKKNDELREVLKYVPLERLLLETDAPFLPPQPFRGKLNTPLLIPLAYKEAAEIKKIGIEEIATNVKRNLLHLLGCS